MAACTTFSAAFEDTLREDTLDVMGVTFGRKNVWFGVKNRTA